jgi:RNA polymerase sigma factor (sigma-70 family)
VRFDQIWLPGGVSDGKIPADQAGELADCFARCAPGLFGYAFALTRGDRALADGLVLSAFMAATDQWAKVRDLDQAQRLAWLQATIGADDSGRQAPDRQAFDGQAARYAGRYDLAGGRARFAGWLRERTASPPDPEAPDPEASAPDPAGEPLAGDLAVALRTTAEQIMVVAQPLPDQLARHADEVVIQLYVTHYRSLVRLATLLVRDEPAAEELVQDCFIALNDGWHRRREEDKALAYLRQAIVHRSRSVLRHHRRPPDRRLEGDTVIAALQNLPERQRQALILRYYGDLSEAQIAEMMGISKAAVKSHTARGMSTLRAIQERTA